MQRQAVDERAFRLVAGAIVAFESAQIDARKAVGQWRVVKRVYGQGQPNRLEVDANLMRLPGLGENAQPA